MALLINFLLTTGMLICIFIIFALSKKLKNATHNKILISIFIVFLFTILNFYSDINQLSSLYLFSFLIVDMIGFLIGPLLLIYVQLLHQSNKRQIKQHIKHFIPLFIYFIFIAVPSFYLVYTGQFLFSYQSLFQEHNFLLHFQAIYLLVYCWLALRKLNNYQKLTKQHYSDLSNKNLNWIRFLFIGMIATVSLDVLITAYEVITGNFFMEAEHVITLFMVSMVLYLGYYGYSQSSILLPEYLFEQSTTTLAQSKTTTITHHLSNASENEIEILKQQLLTLLEKEKAYLNEDLTLRTLASQLSTTEKKLSALLNHYLNTNFYDFVNGYRVEAVCEKLVNKDFSHYTVLAIAYDCGFKSKSSFNRIFKKATNLSPSAYKKQFSSSKA